MPQIQDIAKIHSGVTLRKNKKEAEQAYALIKRGDLDEYHQLNKQSLSWTREIEPKERHLLNPSDIIFSSKGEYNFATVIPGDLGPAVAASTFFVIKNIDHVLLPEYLAWFINCKEGQGYLSKVQKRTSISYISKTKFVEMPVAIPPMETQELIVKIEKLKIEEQYLRQALQERRKELIDATLLDQIEKSARKT